MVFLYWPALRRLNLLPYHIIRTNTTYEPPISPAKPTVNPHRNFYRTFGRPVAKGFLISMLTFQAVYWSWLKLESDEIKEETSAEIKGLETELKGLTKNGL